MKAFTLSFSLFLLAACSYGQKMVSQSEFKKLMKDSNAQIVDVRTANEVAQGKIQGSLNIDYFKSDFMETAKSKLDKNKPVLVYCAAGGRSASAAKDLKKAGFKKVYDLEGGYDNWKE
jgi:rhodanese-related sulfurtransferase